MTTKPKLFILRHGERVDFVFRDWMSTSFDSDGNYKRTDLNMPKTLPERTNAPSSFSHDCPLTNIGLFQAETIGEGFPEEITHIFCSPSLRCVQTSDAFLRGYKMRDEVKIKVEPALFEWLWFYDYKPPEFMTPKELSQAGYNIDLEYTPAWSVEKLKGLRESFEELHTRNFSFTKSIVESTLKRNVLFVGHTITLETCSRFLIGKELRGFEEMDPIIRRMPFCALLKLEQKGGDWGIEDVPAKITHEGNHRYNRDLLK